MISNVEQNRMNREVEDLKEELYNHLFNGTPLADDYSERCEKLTHRFDSVADELARDLDNRAAFASIVSRQRQKQTQVPAQDPMPIIVISVVSLFFLILMAIVMPSGMPYGR